jgi:hypothetical protein
MPNPELAGGIGTGHELMLQSPIMRYSPPIQVKAQQRRFPTAAIELEKLLCFSEGLDLIRCDRSARISISTSPRQPIFLSIPEMIIFSP